MLEPEISLTKQMEKDLVSTRAEEFSKVDETPDHTEFGHDKNIELPDMSYIERNSRASLLNRFGCKLVETNSENAGNTEGLLQSEGLTAEEKARIKEETNWSDEIVDNIENWDQYEALKKAGLIEVEINGRKCLVKADIDLDYKDEDGLTNRQRMAQGLAPLDSKTGKPLELHHLGQKPDSPLVELTEEEHRTGEYKDGLKMQSLWHDNAKETEVHGKGNKWNPERAAHWKARAENFKE